MACEAFLGHDERGIHFHLKFMAETGYTTLENTPKPKCCCHFLQALSAAVSATLPLVGKQQSQPSGAVGDAAAQRSVDVYLYLQAAPKTSRKHATTAKH